MSIVLLNIGGRTFSAMRQNLQRDPSSALSHIVQSYVNWKKSNTRKPLDFKTPFCNWCHASRNELFLDVNPDAFQQLLNWLRYGSLGQVNASDLPMLTQTASQLGLEILLEKLNRRSSQRPSQLVVQCTDQIQFEQGVKKHAVHITFGNDGCKLSSLCARIRHDLSDQLSTSFWQLYQTGERSVFFVTTRMSSGSADVMMTSLVQGLLEHNTSLGYQLISSYMALTPDAQHTSVRTLIHHFNFRRISVNLTEIDPSTDDNDDSVILEDIDKASQMQVGPMVEEESEHDSLPNTMRIFTRK